MTNLTPETNFCYMGPYLEQPLKKDINVFYKECDNEYCTLQGARQDASLDVCSKCKKTLKESVGSAHSLFLSFDNFCVMDPSLNKKLFISVANDRVWIPTEGHSLGCTALVFEGQHTKNNITVDAQAILAELEKFKKHYELVINTYEKVFGLNLHVKFGFISDCHRPDFG